MIALYHERPRLQHILLEETPLPPRVHEALLSSEREAARTVAGLLRRYPEVRHRRLADAAVMAVQTVESLTHRFAAHPGEGSRGMLFGRARRHARGLPHAGGEVSQARERRQSARPPCRLPSVRFASAVKKTERRRCYHRG